MWPAMVQAAVAQEMPATRPLVGVAWHGWQPTPPNFSGAKFRAQAGGWFLQTFKVVSAPAGSALQIGSVVTLESLRKDGYAVKIQPVCNVPPTEAFLDDAAGDDLILQLTLLALHEALFEDVDLFTAKNLAESLVQQIRWKRLEGLTDASGTAGN